MTVYAYIPVDDHRLMPPEAMALIAVVFKLCMNGMGKDTLLGSLYKALIDVALKTDKVLYCFFLLIFPFFRKGDTFWHW
ncbi:MAG: hypothetical protein HZB81_04795 [Deltaproteobacteria bacterium]|nr:hypothetical protein [Deltaproteobacteria bacterium]